MTTPILNTLEMERYIAASAKRADLTVKWHDERVAKTDGKTIHLPRINAAVTQADYDKLRHFVTHEVDHLLYTDFKLVQEKGVHAGNSLLGAIWNCLEDHRIEYLGDKEYIGDRMCNDAVGQTLIKEVCDAATNAGAAAKEQVDTIMPLLRFNAEVQADYHPSNHGSLPMLDKHISPEAQPLLDKLIAGNYADVLRNVRNIEDKKAGSAATYELARRIFEEVYEQDADKEEQRVKQEQQKQQGKGQQKQEGQGQPQQGAGEEGEGDGQESEGKAGQATEGDGEGEEGKAVTYKAFFDDVHDPKERASTHNLDLDYSKYRGRNDYQPATPQQVCVNDQTERPLQDSHRLDGIKDAVNKTSQGFAHRVRTLLQIRSRDRYQYGQKKGKLHGSALHRITVPDAPGYSDRIFKRKNETNVLDAAVTLLVDQSGSMGGSRYNHAAAAAVMLSETIGNVLHVPVEILSFTDGGHCEDGPMVQMYVHRKFDNKRVAQDTMIARLADSGRRMNSNPDGDAIVFAFDRLIKRKEPRKVLIVFSDGQPACGGRGDICWYTKKVIGEIEKKSPVEIIGVGIETTCVADYYTEHYTIYNTTELERALLQLIERKLV